MMGLMKGMGLDSIGTENPKKKTGLFVLGWFLVVIGLSYGMQISIEKRLCAFRAATVECEIPVWQIGNSN